MLLSDVDLFIDTVWDTAPQLNIRPEVPFGQFCDETDVGKSDYWKKNKNPGGLRVTYSGEISNTWASGRTAALGMLHRLCLYIHGNDNNFQANVQYDPAPEEVGKAGYLGIAKKLADLSGRWAENRNYAKQIVENHLNVAFPAGSDAQGTAPTVPVGAPPVAEYVFGKVPHPAFLDHPITKSNGQGAGYYGKRSVRGVVWHRMIGSLRGTDGYFKNPDVAALTDYGVGTLVTDGSADDGVIIRWNNPLGNQSGWASGPVSAPYGDGLAFLNKYVPLAGIGYDVVNRDQASIEISGLEYTTPLSQKAKMAVAAITAYWADQYRIPYDVFPIAPQDGFSFVRWHQEFTIGSGKVCPGQVVIDATSEMIEMTRQIMKQYQAVGTPVPTPPLYVKAKTYSWLAEAEAAKKIDRAIQVNVSGKNRSIPIYALPRNYVVATDTARLTTMEQGSTLSGPPIKKGTKFHSDYVLRSPAGKAFAMTKNGNFVASADLLPKIQITERGTITERKTPNSAPTIVRKATKP